jgi:hypothetical protein
LDSHFHPSLLIMADEELHLFCVLCKTFECTTHDINLAVLSYKLNEAFILIFWQGTSHVYVCSNRF